MTERNPVAHNAAERGRIVRGVGGLYAVERRIGADGAESGSGRSADVFFCSARGIFRKKEITPLVGDDVMFHIDPIRPEYGSIAEISDRRSELKRPPVANVDQLIIVLTLSVPSPDFYLADKLIIQALSNNIVPALCFNKSDLPSNDEYSREEEGYIKAGLQTFKVSRSDAESIKTLERALTGKVSIFAGQSGVGKSTLFNTIIKDMKMEIGDMSRRIGRGKQTTRHVELTRLITGGWLVDSPGFSLFEASIRNFRELDRLYPEFSPYIGQCKFKECSHIHEPGCAVLDALGGGAIHAGRHGRYAELYRAYLIADNRKYSK